MLQDKFVVVLLGPLVLKSGRHGTKTTSYLLKVILALFADDMFLYRPIASTADFTSLQQDIAWNPGTEEKQKEITNEYFSMTNMS